MLLSIIILTHNANGLTLRCLESMSPMMEKREDIGIIIVDNGSQQEIQPLLQEKNYSWSDRLQLIRLSENKGVAGGRNEGLKLADSEYILLLDNDTVIIENAIEDLLAIMEANPQYGLLAPCLISQEGEIQKSFKPYPGISEKIKNVFGAKDTVERLPENQEIFHPFYVIGACQLFRSSLLKSVGLLDEKIFFGPEDADFCMRIRRTGYEVAYAPSVRIIHDWQRSSHRSLLSKTSRRHIAGLLYFYRKWKRFW